jgi:hypothetical protein
VVIASTFLYLDHSAELAAFAVNWLSQWLKVDVPLAGT